MAAPRAARASGRGGALSRRRVPAVQAGCGPRPGEPRSPRHPRAERRPRVVELVRAEPELRHATRFTTRSAPSFSFGASSRPSHASNARGVGETIEVGFGFPDARADSSPPLPTHRRGFQADGRRASDGLRVPRRCAAASGASWRPQARVGARGGVRAGRLLAHRDAGRLSSRALRGIGAEGRAAPTLNPSWGASAAPARVSSRRAAWRTVRGSARARRVAPRGALRVPALVAPRAWRGLEMGATAAAFARPAGVRAQDGDEAHDVKSTAHVRKMYRGGRLLRHARLARRARVELVPQQADVLRAVPGGGARDGALHARRRRRTMPTTRGGGKTDTRARAGRFRRDRSRPRRDAGTGRRRVRARVVDTPSARRRVPGERSRGEGVRARETRACQHRIVCNTTPRRQNSDARAAPTPCRNILGVPAKGRRVVPAFASFFARARPRARLSPHGMHMHRSRVRADVGVHAVSDRRAAPVRPPEVGARGVVHVALARPARASARPRDEGHEEELDRTAVAAAVLRRGNEKRRDGEDRARPGDADPSRARPRPSASARASSASGASFLARSRRARPRRRTATASRGADAPSAGSAAPRRGRTATASWLDADPAPRRAPRTRRAPRGARTARRFHAGGDAPAGCAPFPPSTAPSPTES